LGWGYPRAHLAAEDVFALEPPQQEAHVVARLALVQALLEHLHARANRLEVHCLLPENLWTARARRGEDNQPRPPPQSRAHNSQAQDREAEPSAINFRLPIELFISLSQLEVLSPTSLGLNPLLPLNVFEPPPRGLARLSPPLARCGPWPPCRGPGSSAPPQSASRTACPAPAPEGPRRVRRPRARRS
jgi:hypothetical protein